MQWRDKAIILSASKLGEHSARVVVLSEQFGLYAGVAKGAFGKARRGLYQPGNIVSARWHARLREQMGGFECELALPVAAQLMHDARKLACLLAACELTLRTLGEREAHPEFYQRFEHFVLALLGESDWLARYVELELALLQEAGFGLDLTCCAATGDTQNLIYVSPRSARAVCSQAGAPYHDRLLPLPRFLLHAASERVPLADILCGLRLTGYFLERHCFAPRSRLLPESRTRFLHRIDDEARELAGMTAESKLLSV